MVDEGLVLLDRLDSVILRTHLPELYELLPKAVSEHLCQIARGVEPSEGMSVRRYRHISLQARMSNSSESLGSDYSIMPGAR